MSLSFFNALPKGGVVVGVVEGEGCDNAGLGDGDVGRFSVLSAESATFSIFLDLMVICTLRFPSIGDRRSVVTTTSFSVSWKRGSKMRKV